MANIALRQHVVEYSSDYSTTLVQKIVRMNTRVFAGVYEDPPYTFEQYRERLSQAESIILTAETQGVVIANCVAYEMGDCLYVWILAVMPQVQRNRLATRFMDAIEIMARERGLQVVRTKVYNVSTPMQILLLSRGYHIVQVVPSPTDSKYNEVFFQLHLTSST